METFKIVNDCLVEFNLLDATSHIVSRNIKKIGAYAYSKCEDLQRLYLPWYIEEVPETNFVDRTKGVFKVMLQHNRLTIYGEKGTAAERVANKAGIPFVECNEIIKDNKYLCYLGREEKVAIPKDIEHIGMGAFCNAPQVKVIVLPQSLKYIDKCAFICTAIEKMVIPKGVISLDSGIFKHCKCLTEVVFENGETKLDNDCFVGCQANLVIKAPAGGYVEEYAKKYNLTFKAI